MTSSLDRFSVADTKLTDDDVASSLPTGDVGFVTAATDDDFSFCVREQMALYIWSASLGFA